MEFGSLKPVVTSLLMPLAFLPLLGLLGLLWVAGRKRSGWMLPNVAFGTLWLLSCQGIAVWLARQSDLPVASSGGSGWAAGTLAKSSEAEVAVRVARQDYSFTLRWIENQSRDTAENAQRIAPLLKRDGVQRVALVTDALHMPRAIAEFERTGLIITPAPMGYVLPARSGALQWLPSADGMTDTTRIIHEVLGLAATKLR